MSPHHYYDSLQLSLYRACSLGGPTDSIVKIKCIHYTLGLLYTQILWDHAPELEHDAAWLQPQEGDVKILGRVDPLKLFDDPRRQGPVQGGPTVFYSGNGLCVLVDPFLF